MVQLGKDMRTRTRQRTRTHARTRTLVRAALEHARTHPPPGVTWGARERGHPLPQIFATQATIYLHVYTGVVYRVMERRTLQLNVRLTAEEAGWVERLSRELGLDVSPMVRWLVKRELDMRDGVAVTPRERTVEEE